MLPPPEEGDGDTPRRTVKLDMRRSVRDNMERLFHTARRGRRGLEHLAERRAVLRAELATVQAARQEALLGGIGPAAGEAGRPDRNTVALGALRGAALPRNVQLFVSDDGFALLRGRDARGNIAARKLAAAHDIWLHADGGPGSHVIIRRAHAGQEVPERTLDQAGALAACKSWQKDAARARILYAEVRHIRSMRGAGTGTVRMDKDPLQPRGAGGCRPGDPFAAGTGCFAPLTATGRKGPQDLWGKTLSCSLCITADGVHMEGTRDAFCPGGQAAGYRSP